mgnify:CR=1 FL=1
MGICAILLSVGISFTVMCPEKPDAAAQELRSMRQEMEIQEQVAEQKVRRLWKGVGECPECGPKKLNPRTLTRDE